MTTTTTTTTTNAKANTNILIGSTYELITGIKMCGFFRKSLQEILMK